MSTASESAQDPPPSVIEQSLEQAGNLVEDPRAKSGWLRWSPVSMEKLIDAEKRLLSSVPASIQSTFINVRHWNSKLYTITAKKSQEEKAHPVPFVLVHGFAAGVAIWKANIGSMAEKRTVHAFDLLGFGRSTRAPFAVDPVLAELEFVESIEDWRRAMKLERMILVGHSFGAYLAASYALEHPSRVRHLVLVDPWGFSERPHTPTITVPIWMRAVGSIMSNFTPLAALRAAGPLGPMMVRKLRSDLGVRYSHEDQHAIYDYIYQCNAREPTGEIAFRTLTRGFGWPRRPMINRFLNIDSRVPVTFVCGSKSWINIQPIYDIQNTRTTSYVNVKVVNSAGHHVYADQSQEFNEILREVSNLVDKELDLSPGPKPKDDHDG